MACAFFMGGMATHPTDQRGIIMKARLEAQKILFILFFVCGPLIARDAKVTSVLADIQGKEVQILTVEYPPGGYDPVHRHNAHGFIYVLEGSIVMGLNGGKSVTLTAGQTFYEGPNDIHTVGRNASKTEPAKFVVFLLKDKDAPILIPVK